MRSSETSTTRPAPGLALLEHRGEEARQRGQRADVVTDAAAGIQRDAVAVGQLHRQARARPEGADVVGRAVPVRAAQPVPAHAAVHEAGVARHRLGGLEAEPVECVGSQVGQEDVGRREQRVEAGPRFGRAQVQHDAALAPVVLGEGGIREVLPDPERTERVAHRVAARWLHLDHVGAPVRQQRAGRRRRHPDAELHHPQPGQGRESVLAHLATPLDRISSARACSVSFITLPVALSGSAPTISTARGTL